MNWKTDKPDEDSLAKIIESIEGALLPMMRSMLPQPTLEQLKLLGKEMGELTGRLLRLGMEIAYGDDENAQTD